MDLHQSLFEFERHRMLDPINYFAVSSIHDPISILGTRMRREDYFLWQSALPSNDEDIEIVLARLRKLLGRGDQYLMSAINAHYRLRELPQLHDLQQCWFHLDLERLKAIDSVLCKADISIDEHLGFIDSALTEFLMPSRPNQILPSAGKIKNRLNAIITMLDESISENDPAPAPSDSFGVGYYEDRGVIRADLDAVSAHEIELRVRKHALAHGISQAEALVALLKGDGTTNVTINLFKASDIRKAPGWVSGIGYLSATATKQLLERGTKEVDIDALQDKVSSAYTTPPDIRSMVVGLEGTCAMGGCGAPAHSAQMDHRINFADGGPTTAANLAPLCVKHHTMKTDRRMTYVMDSHTRHKFFLFEDGTWAEAEANGPLADSERRWMQTVSQRIEKRRARIRAQSQAERAEEVERAGPPPKPEPPPI